MTLEQELTARIDAYLRNELSLAHLWEWLMTFADHFAHHPQDVSAGQLWGEAVLLISELADGTMSEQEARIGLHALLTKHPLTT